MYMEIKGKPLTIYGFENIDMKAKTQMYEAMSQLYAVRGALMPDAHLGYALPIGGVIATKDMIVPSYIGFDIGCGMCAYQLKGVGALDIIHLRDEIFDEIYKKIPVGHNHHKENKKWDEWKDIDCSDWFWRNFIARGGLRQIGTLGGGNHFIEIGWDKDGDKSVWIIIHSGSRGIGHDTGTYYMKKAGGGKAREGNFPLSADSQIGQNYIKDMNFCLEFALQNRSFMVNKVLDILKSLIGHKISVETFINRNHNHAEFKDGLWIHRKGATHAEEGMMGVVPGNMRDGAFIVRGKGNTDSLCSSSHGAGRLYSRSKAKEKLSVKDFREGMKDIKAKVGKSTLDESFAAYKDIFKVMEDQQSLVDIIAHVKPLVNIKW